MAFATGKDVMRTVEDVVRELWKSQLGIQLPGAFPRVTYEDAMSKYGSDKPERRIGMEVRSVSFLLVKPSLNF
jgi:aspartyl-tRNA synthetase